MPAIFHLRGLLALALAKLGFRIFPLIPGGKTPAIEKWPDRATTDEAIIRAWWSQKDYNIGLVTGPYSRVNGGSAETYWLVVVDYDMKDGQLGASALLRHELFGLSDTKTSQTPHGIHKFYWASVAIPNSLSRIAPNVDVRGTRGYVVAPGSTIKDVTYQWVGEFTEPAPFPEEFQRLALVPSKLDQKTHSKAPIGELDRADSIERVRQYLVNLAPEAISGSHGDETTYRVAAYVKDLGVSEPVCFELLHAHWNEEKAIPPWSYDELRTKVSNAYRYGQNAPGSADPLNEFGDGSNVGTSGLSDQTARQIPIKSAFPIDPATIPPRDWIVPGLLLKKNVTMLVAPPGSGKSLLTLQIAIMVATGMSWGGWNPRKQCKVLVINSEDDFDEMRRRLYAAAQEMGVDQESLIGRVFLAETPESIVIARLKTGTRTIVRTPLLEQLVQLIQANDIGCVMVDPFAETFEADENSNSEVKWAAVLWREVCRRTDSALELVHHSRKYADDMAGEADVTRGGGSLIGVARILCTLFTMTEAEARTMGVPVDQRTDYVRFDDAKANHSRRGAVRWFKKNSVTIPNAKGTVPGDEVGALVPWKPDLMEGITEIVLAELRDTINNGVLDQFNKPIGSYFTISTAGRNNERWVGHVLIATLGCDEMRAKAILKEWTKLGWIETFDYQDLNQRKTLSGVRCSAANWPQNKGQTG